MNNIKNNSLPSILDIIENIGIKKVFIKLDLQQSYNNIQIKEESEQKVIFTTIEGLFKPIVIFFKLTNSPAMFQMMMNRILWDFINTGKVVSFINDVIMRAEGEEEYDEIVEEVVKRLVENDLYMKPEKCKQKVREVGFLEVIIRIEDIKCQDCRKWT